MTLPSGYTVMGSARRDLVDWCCVCRRDVLIEPDDDGLGGWHLATHPEPPTPATRRQHPDDWLDCDGSRAPCPTPS